MDDDEVSLRRNIADNPIDIAASHALQDWLRERGRDDHVEIERFRLFLAWRRQRETCPTSFDKDAFLAYFSDYLDPLRKVKR